MAFYAVDGRVSEVVSETIEAEDESAAALEYLRRHHGALLKSINGALVRGICGCGCYSVIFYGDGRKVVRLDHHEYLAEHVTIGQNPAQSADKLMEAGI